MLGEKDLPHLCYFAKTLIKLHIMCMATSINLVIKRCQLPSTGCLAV